MRENETVRDVSREVRNHRISRNKLQVNTNERIFELLHNSVNKIV